MNVNLHMEDVLNMLDEGEFVGKGISPYAQRVLWYFGSLDDRGVFQPMISAASLSELADQIKQIKELEAAKKMRELREAGL